MRRAPQDVRSALHDRWESTNRPSSTKSFLHTTEHILGRGKGRAGLHQLTVKLATFNSTRVQSPSEAQRRWFNSIEPALLIHELNQRASLRKNGYPVKQGYYVSYYDGGELCVGVVVSIFVGSRATDPFIVGCAVCTILKLRASRLQNTGHAKLYRVNSIGPASTSELVCCTKLKHRYFKTLWDEDPDQYFALVQFDEY